MRGNRSKPSGSSTAPSAQRLWDVALPRIRSQVGEQNFNAWIAPLAPFGDAESVALAAPTKAISASVNRHFVPLITKILTEVAGRRCNVRVSDETHTVEATTRQPLFGGSWADEEATFDRFVVGESNLEAFTHAVAVAEGRFGGPGPLVLCGGVGLGKTHLACAIANSVRRAHPDRLVVCQPSTDFVDRLLAVMRGEGPASSSEQVRDTAVLILDDVHFLAGQAATQEALVSLFSILHEHGTPVVLTSDRPPQEIPDVDERLRRRFEGGVLAGICRPELDLRRRILERKAADRGIDLPEDVAAFLAERIVGSGRALEGLLTRVHAYAVALTPSETGEVVLTVKLAADALRAFETPQSPISPEVIRAAVCEARGLPARALMSRRRTRDVTVARQLAMYLSRKYSGLSLSEIARRFGRRDHSTVLHAYGVVEGKRTSDPAFDAEVGRLEEVVRLRGR
jgi:chromosomal replication initiator protein